MENDLISRQAAIDAIKKWGLIDGLSEGQAIEILADEEKLPPAQPEILACGQGELVQAGSSDLISRQAAIDALCRGCSGCCIPCDPLPCKEVETIQNLPSAQPERKKGKWIDQDGGAFYTMECSECHKEPLLDEYGDYVQSDFCPHCGADMRGEQDG